MVSLPRLHPMSWFGDRPARFGPVLKGYAAIGLVVVLAALSSIGPSQIAAAQGEQPNPPPSTSRTAVQPDTTPSDRSAGDGSSSTSDALSEAPPAKLVPEIYGSTQYDLDGDGLPDLVEIDTAFAAARDRVLVYDGGGDMSSTDDWSRATDYHNDTWLFDVGADGDVQLVLRFSLTERGVEAEFYDDVDGDQTVNYELRDHKRVEVTESPYPRLRMVSTPDWIRPDGGLNYNFVVLQDGAVFRQRGPEFIAARLKLDGKTDYHYQYADVNDDGIPDYYVERLLAEIPDEWGSPRSGIQINGGRVPPKPSPRAVFWPLLDRDTTAEQLNYFSSLPAVQYDWFHARVAEAGNVGYPIEQGLHINNLNPLHPGQRNVADFENAMSYYDLAEDQDTFPELMVRHLYFEADDRYGYQIEPALNEIRYSWNQLNHPGFHWDFKVGLLGRHKVTSTITVGDYPLVAIPPPELPDWVVERRWDFGTFVAREGGGYASSEGIYEFAPVEGAAPLYMRGEISQPPEEIYSTIRAGYRGEYSFALGAQPLLYFSPVDRKLHLRGAQKGLWNVDQQASVRYADLDGDGYFDQWVHRDRLGDLRVEFVQQLIVARHHLLHSDSHQVVIRRAQPRSSLFEVLPPTSKAELDSLGSRLEQQTTPFAPGDFGGMLDQFVGPELRISGATLRDYRQEDEDSFRFVLELGPGFQATDSLGLDLSDLPPGGYLVTYRAADGFAVRPLESPTFSLALDIQSIDGNAFVAREPLFGQLKVRNLGHADAQGLKLIVDAQRHGEPQSERRLVEIFRERIELQAGDVMRKALTWRPALGGRWEVTARLEGPEGAVLAEAREQVGLADSLTSGVESSGIPAAGDWPALTFIPLLSLALFVGWIGFVALNSASSERSQ